MRPLALLAAAFVVSFAVSLPARAEFAHPPDGQAIARSGYSEEDVPRYDSEAPEPLQRSTVRLHVGPAVLASPGSAGLYAALDLGRGAVGARFSGAWLSTEREGGIAQYGGELWIDFARDAELHPIVAAGAALVRAREADGGQENSGAGTLRGALEYELPVRDADARVGLSISALVPAIGTEREEPWVVGALTVGAGF